MNSAENHSPDYDESYHVASRQWLRYKRAYDRGHEDYMSQAKRCAEFYAGNQWRDKDRKRLEAEGRPALTINVILSTVNAVLGEQSMNRMDIKFKPRRDASAETAHALTRLFQQIGDNNRLDWVESEVFADGIIEERGYFDVRMNFDNHIGGEVEITACDPKDIILDPDAKEYNPETWSEVFKSRWMSLDEIEATYGKDKADKLKDIGVNGENLSRESMIIDEDQFGDIEGGVYAGADGDESDRKTIRYVKVIERQYKKTHYAKHFIDYETGDIREVPENWEDERVEAFRMKFGLGIVKRLIPKIRWTVTADQCLLHDDWSPYSSFTIIPFFPYFRRGKPFGVVSNLLSPQEQLNKISSQELHIVNTTANSGWIVEEGVLTNMTEDDLAENGAKTGLVLVHGRGSNPPQKINPNQIPTGLDRIGMKAAENIRNISGVNQGMLGNVSAEVSGVALEQQQARGQVQIQVPLDNLARTRHFLAKKVLELVQQFYTDSRIFHITDESHPEKPEEEVSINLPQEDGSIANDITLGTYDIVVSTQPARDNFGDIQFAEALQLRQAGVMIPDHYVIGYSNLSRKEEIVQDVKQLTGLGEPTPEEAEMMAVQQQMAMKQAELELAKLESEAQKIAAEAAKAAAEGEAVAAELEIERSKIEAQVQTKREELLTRIQLAQMTNRVKQQGLGVQMLAQAAGAARDNQNASAKSSTPTKKDK